MIYHTPTSVRCIVHAFAAIRSIARYKGQINKKPVVRRTMSRRCLGWGQGDERISNGEFASIPVLACNLAVDILPNGACLSLADLPRAPLEPISSGTRPRIRRLPPPSTPPFTRRLFLCRFNFAPIKRKRIKRQRDVQDRLECLPSIEEISSVSVTMLSANIRKKFILIIKKLQLISQYRHHYLIIFMFLFFNGT